MPRDPLAHVGRCDTVFGQPYGDGANPDTAEARAERREMVEQLLNRDIADVADDMLSDIAFWQSFAPLLVGGKVTFGLTEWGRKTFEQHLINRIAEAVNEARA